MMQSIYVVSGIFFGIALAAIACAVAIIYIFKDK